MPRGFRHGPLESLVLSYDSRAAKKGAIYREKLCNWAYSAPVLEQVDTVGLGCISGV